jgi:hypothetical protein
MVTGMFSTDTAALLCNPREEDESGYLIRDWNACRAAVTQALNYDSLLALGQDTWAGQVTEAELNIVGLSLGLCYLLPDK